MKNNEKYIEQLKALYGKYKPLIKTYNYFIGGNTELLKKYMNYCKDTLKITTSEKGQKKLKNEIAFLREVEKLINKNKNAFEEKSLKEYFEDWDKPLNEEKPHFEERKPIEGFKVGDYVQVIGFNKDVLKNAKTKLIGRFGIIDSMKNNGQPDCIVFLTQRGGDTDEADLADKYILKPAKKCPECGYLYTDICKNCSSKKKNMTLKECIENNLMENYFGKK